LDTEHDLPSIRKTLIKMIYNFHKAHNRTLCVLSRELETITAGILLAPPTARGPDDLRQDLLHSATVIIVDRMLMVGLSTLWGPSSICRPLLSSLITKEVRMQV
jgi:hypothetical protein